MLNFEKLIVATVEALERKKLPYMIVGGQAVLLHGEPRFTKDIDITLGVDIEHIEQIRGIAQELKLEPLKGATNAFVKQTRVFPVQDNESGLRVDFIFSFTPYERQAIERITKITLGSTSVCFASVEDTIIHKMFAGRPRDTEDVRGIIKRSATVDSNYIEKWLSEFSNVANKNLTAEWIELKKKTT